MTRRSLLFPIPPQTPPAPAPPPVLPIEPAEEAVSQAPATGGEEEAG
jgi:hypothetical protein